MTQYFAQLTMDMTELSTAKLQLTEGGTFTS